MTKLIFDNAMTAHVWAQQTQERGRSANGNLYFEGRTIYSYGTHYVAGYVAPGPLYLVNRDSYSMSTNRHIALVWGAIDFGRGKYENHAGVQSLTLIQRVFEAMRRGTYDGPRAIKELQKLIETAPDEWPGEEGAARLFVACGDSPKVAERRARAGAARVLRNAAKAKAAKEAKAFSDQLSMAKLFSRDYDSAHVTERTRHELAKAGAASQWQEARHISEVTEESREFLRASKAAKVKGWSRIAAHCRGLYKAARAEIAKYEKSKAGYAERAAIRHAIGQLRRGPENLNETRASWKKNLETSDLSRQERFLQSRANGFEGMARNYRAISESRYAKATLSPATRAALAAHGENARAMSQEFLARARVVKSQMQEVTRGLWLSGALDRVPYDVGQLSDSEGGALLRAENVERDDSGQITGGDLVTSWGARVPLPHAIRAFQFLKLCRDKGQAWATNGHTIRVGHFTLDKIDTRGNFVAGCHRINWQEVERLARLLHVLDLAPADHALAPSRGAA